jgi:hypothetical protein
MPYEIMERPVYDPTMLPDSIDGGDNDTERRETPSDAPPTFGRCPVCNKPLFPRCRYTGAPKAPPVGTGYESRAKCGGCGSQIVYIGDYKWRVLLESDLSDEDRQSNSMDRMMGFVKE